MSSNTLPSWRIFNTSSGADLGIYEGATAEDAIRAMLADAGAPDAEPDPDLRAVPADDEGEE